jgi:outer membrane protein OmpA-like peptidoglycan-associated protein
MGRNEIKWILVFGLCLFWCGPSIAQAALTPEQIINSLHAKAPSQTQHLSADDILARLKNLIAVEPNGIPSPDDVKEIAPIVTDLPSVSMEIYFDFNSADISPESMPSLLALGKALADPGFQKDKFMVGGHTDGVGSDTYNLKLSQARADAVRHFLVQRFPIAPEALTALGFGKTSLKDPTNPDAAVNRRVQVINLGQSGS